MNDFEVVWVKNGIDATKSFEKTNFDLVILDIMLPGKDGFSVAKEIKEQDSELPIIFLTAKSLKIDKLKGFRLGADDFITKPIDEEVFLARIHALLKRTSTSNGYDQSTKEYQIGTYLFDWNNQMLIRHEARQRLTPKEARVLKMLCDHKNKVLDRKKALKEIWGSNSLFNRKSMDVFIFKLRKYLGQDSRIKITNIHGKGFMLEEN